MFAGVRPVARAFGVTGLGSLAALHAVWAAGSPWPAQSVEQLGEAVVGQSVRMPSAAPTLSVAVAAAAAGALAAGLLGDGPLQRRGMRAIGSGLLLRAALGGDAALAALKLPPDAETFRRLDRRYYRPFAAALGLSLWLAAGSAPEAETTGPYAR